MGRGEKEGKRTEGGREGTYVQPEGKKEGRQKIRKRKERDIRLCNLSELGSF